VRVVSTIAVLLASVSALAQSGSRDLDLRVQIGAELTRPYKSILFQADKHKYRAQPDYQTGLQLRMLGELPGTSNFYYELGGRLETSSRLNYNVIIDGTYINTYNVQISYSYFSFGGAYILNWNSGFSIGAHLEGRVERISSSGPVYKDYVFDGNLDGSATYLRPWFRLSTDFTFNNSGKVRPFIGIEGAFPITKRGQRSNWEIGQPQDKRLMESIAPQGSAACYFGFRL